LVAIPTLTFAQTQLIKGQVVDHDTEAPLIGASVIITSVEPLKGAYTDDEGRFLIERIPVGRHNLKVEYLGYKSLFINDVWLSSGKQLQLNLSMQEEVPRLKEVLIVPRQNKSRTLNSLATVSARVFSVEETERYAASFQDPARMAQSYAGVASASDESNEIVIRGNSPKGLLWRVEGIEIPNPSHFSSGDGSTGGGISMLSNSVLANSDFFTSAFPAEYGNALSGVFDLKLRRGNTDTREYSIQAGALGLQFAAEGPFTKRKQGSYLFNYRYSTVALISQLGFLDKFGFFEENVITPTFQDLSFKLYMPTNKKGKFSLFGIGGRSNAGQEAFRDSTLWVNPRDNEDETDLRMMGVVGLTHSYLFDNQKTLLKTIAAFSTEYTQYRVDTLTGQFDPTTTNDNRFSYTHARLSSSITHKFSPRHLLKTGLIYSNLGFNIFSRILNLDTEAFDTRLDNQGNTHMLQAYGQWQYRRDESLQFNTGIHATYLLLNGNYSIEPRVGFKWQFLPKQSISAGIGLHSRIEPISFYLTQSVDANGIYDTHNRNLQLTQSLHNILGYDWNFARDFHLKAEIYYQYLYNIPVAIDSQSVESAVNISGGLVSQPFVNGGTARNYGIELGVEKFLSKYYYFLFTLSLFDSRYESLDGTVRNTRFNSNYLLNALGGKEFPVGKRQQNLIGFNMRVIWQGGQRIIPIDLAASIDAGEAVYDNSRAFEERVPDYFRWDLGVNFRRNKARYSWNMSLDIQNLINRANIFVYRYDPDEEAIIAIKTLGFVPVFNYRVEF